ncbi:MAG: response regulator transcription factor [Bdellovibrionales bacterium]
MQLLLVEDDPQLSEYLSNALGREGFRVELCTTADEVRSYFLNGPEPSLVVLDRMLGRSDAGALVPDIKKKFPSCAILVLSSLDMASEKARLLDQGVDDYLSKPFVLEELTARLRSLARRASSPAAQSTIRMVGNLTLNLQTQAAQVGPQKLDLTRKEFQLLSLLTEHPGRVFNRFQILDRVWEMERMVESNVVETAIKNLRRKLEGLSCQARIESKRNVGYWIEA